MKVNKKSRPYILLKPIVCILLYIATSNYSFADITRELLLAVRTNDFKHAEILIKNGAPVNGDTWATSPLYTAVEHDNFHMFMLLLYYGADLNKILDIPYFGSMRIAEYAMERGSRRIAQVAREVSGKLKLNTDLRKAIHSLDYDAVEKLLKAGAEIDEFFGWTGVHIPGWEWLTAFDYAVYMGNERVVKLLIAYDTGKNIKYGRDTLEIAVYNQNLRLIELLLQNGGYSFPPLDAAAIVGNTEIILLLLDHGANPDATYLNGHSASDIAIKNRNAEAALLLFSHESGISDELYKMYCAIYNEDVVKLQQLLNQGCKINQGWITPLAWAAYLGKTDLVMLLLDHGAIVSNEEKRLDSSPVFLAAINGNTAIVRILLDKGALVDSCDEYGWTLLHQAVQSGQADLVELLLQHKASIGHAAAGVYAHSIYPAGRPPHLAAALGDIDILNTFIRNAVPVDYLGTRKQTPLHFAVRFERMAAVEFLIECGADINAGNDSGITPLHLAAENGNKKFIGYLIEKGAAVDRADIESRTPLFYALENGHLDAGILLIKRGADIKKVITCKVYHDRSTLLQLASSSGCLEIVEFLIKHGANVNSLDKNGISALHFAAHHDHYEIVKLLIENDAAINMICNKFNDHRYGYYNKKCTPLDLARSFKIWKLLYQVGAKPEKYF